MKATSEEVIAVSDSAAVAAGVLIAGIGLIFTLFGHDEIIRLHGLLFLAGGLLGSIYVLSNPRAGGLDEQHQYLDGPARVATVAAVFWGVVGFLVGTIIAWQLAFPALN